MTLAEFQTKLSASGIETAYLAHQRTDVVAETLPLPTVVWTNRSDEHFGADNKVYHKDHRVVVELYERLRDESGNEKSVEDTFKDLYYEKSIDYLEDEKIYVITYEMVI